jgi:hypothetical protein
MVLVARFQLHGCGIYIANSVMIKATEFIEILVAVTKPYHSVLNMSMKFFWCTPV